MRHRGRPAGGGDEGFTLIELLTVVLVILTLAAILIPQFGLARERAHKAQCISNQRNIETAVALWHTDNPTSNYAEGGMDGSTPGFATLTGAGGGTVYIGAPQFSEPDNPGIVDGSSYWLSAGGSPANGLAPSYGHVACRVDAIADPWVGSRDTAANAVPGIDHRRGAAASP